MELSVGMMAAGLENVSHDWMTEDLGYCVKKHRNFTAQN
jgi:hypothetical protein